jgi:hypothetical protein
MTVKTSEKYHSDWQNDLASKALKRFRLESEKKEKQTKSFCVRGLLTGSLSYDVSPMMQNTRNIDINITS